MHALAREPRFRPPSAADFAHELESRALGDTGDTASGADADTQDGEVQPLWPYTWGRIFRVLSFPFDALYRIGVTKTIVLGAENLQRLPPRVVFAGTHHRFADLPLIRAGLAKTPARRFAGRLVVATSATEFAKAGPFAAYGRLAFGLYPLRQRGERAASLRGLARLASHGNAVLIFPQGTHVPPERERAGAPEARFRPGVARLAEGLDACVVPFGLAGTEQVIPPDADAFHGPAIGGIPVSIARGPLAIVFGEPLTPRPQGPASGTSTHGRWRASSSPRRWRPDDEAGHVRQRHRPAARRAARPGHRADRAPHLGPIKASGRRRPSLPPRKPPP